MAVDENTNCPTSCLSNFSYTEDPDKALRCAQVLGRVSARRCNLTGLGLQSCMTIRSCTVTQSCTALAFFGFQRI